MCGSRPWRLRRACQPDLTSRRNESIAEVVVLGGLKAPTMLFPALTAGPISDAAQSGIHSTVQGAGRYVVLLADNKHLPRRRSSGERKPNFNRSGVSGYDGGGFILLVVVTRWGSSEGLRQLFHLVPLI